MDIEKITDEIIALSVIGGGVAGATYMTYKTGVVPDFFVLGFGVVLAFYFKKSE